MKKKIIEALKVLGMIVLGAFATYCMVVMVYENGDDYMRNLGKILRYTAESIEDSVEYFMLAIPCALGAKKLYKSIRKDKDNNSKEKA